MKKKIIKLNENDIERLVKKIIREHHESTDEGKMDYIKDALENLSSDDLDKIYLSVEEYDPEYESTN